MKHAHELTGFELKLVIHGRLEVELDAMDVVLRTTGASWCSYSSSALLDTLTITFFEWVGCWRWRTAGGVRERVLGWAIARLLGHGWAGEVWQELGDRAKAETRSSGGSVSRVHGPDAVALVTSRSTDGSGSTTEEAVLAGVFLIKLLASGSSSLLAATNAEESKGSYKTNDSEDSDSKTSLSTAAHAVALLRSPIIGNRGALHNGT